MNRRAVLWSGVFIVGLVLLLGTSPVWSQAVHTGTVTGSCDPAGRHAEPGRHWWCSRAPPSSPGNWSTVSDNNGRVVFLRVPPGTYKATASLSGFNTAQYEDLVVGPGSTMPLTFNLEIAAATGEIVVTSEAPIVDVRSSTIDTSFDEKMLEGDPDERVPDADEIHIGGEYAFLQWRPVVAFRLGVWLDPDHRIQATLDDPLFRALVPPGDDQWHVAGGVGFAFKRIQVDLAADVSDSVATGSLSAVYTF